MAAAQPSLSHADVENILRCLQAALSQDAAVQREAEQALHSVESRPGFCSCLAEIVGNTSSEYHSARWLASVYLKNSITKQWRHAGAAAAGAGRGEAAQQPAGAASLSAEERAHLRTRLLQLIPAQDDNQIAVQVALVFAKVARQDYPKEWPTLLADLLGALGAGASTLTVRRVYLVLHHVLKELSSKRLVVDQRNFADAAAFLFDHVWGQWCDDMHYILTSLPTALAGAPLANQALLLRCERWLMLLKIVRRLILFGHPSDAKSLQPVGAVATCAPAMLQALQQMSALRPAQTKAPRSQLLAMVDRGILKLIKTQSLILDTHPWSLHHAGALIPMLDYCVSAITSATDPRSDPSREAALTRCCAFLINVNNCGAYRGRAGGSGALSGHADASAAATVKQLAATLQPALQAFWSPERLGSLCCCLVQTYLPFNAADLAARDADAEEFYHEHEGGAWQEQLHGCAETLFLSLLTAHRAVLAPLVVSMLQSASAACPCGAAALAAAPASDRVEGVPKALLLKEAVYNAVAIGAYELHDYVDFTSWLRGALLPELADASHPATAVLRHRAAKVLAAWVARITDEDRPAVYRALVAMLVQQQQQQQQQGGAATTPSSGAEPDRCLQLAAADSLRTLVEDWNFQEGPFLDLAAPCLAGLMSILTSSQELDTQTQVFNCVNVIIERLGDAIRPHVGGIMAVLPSVWSAGEGQSLLRIQVLLALQKLVNVLGLESPAAYPLLLPVLQQALQPPGALSAPSASSSSGVDSLNLLEDGLGLWLVALRNAPGTATATVGAAPGAGADPSSPLLQLFPQLLHVMSGSTEYIAAGMHIVRSCLLLGGPDFLQHFGPAIVQVVIGYLGNVNERGSMMLMPVMEFMLIAAPAVAPALLQPALLKLLQLLLSGEESSVVVVAGALSVFARLLLHAPQSFLQLFEAAAAAGVQPRTKADDDGSAPPSALGAATAASPADQLLSSFLGLWLESFDSLATPSERKLSAVSLCSLLGLPTSAPLQHLDSLLASLTAVWFEQEGGGDADEAAHAAAEYFAAGSAILRGFGEDGMDGALEAATSSEDAAGEAARRQAVQDTDPVGRLQIGACLRDQLHACAVRYGAAFHDAFGRLDATIVQQTKKAAGILGA